MKLPEFKIGEQVIVKDNNKDLKAEFYLTIIERAEFREGNWFYMVKEPVSEKTKQSRNLDKTYYAITIVVEESIMKLK